MIWELSSFGIRERPLKVADIQELRVTTRQTCVTGNRFNSIDLHDWIWSVCAIQTLHQLLGMCFLFLFLFCVLFQHKLI